jgi:hypothetical protein
MISQKTMFDRLHVWENRRISSVLIDTHSDKDLPYSAVLRVVTEEKQVQRPPQAAQSKGRQNDT